MKTSFFEEKFLLIMEGYKFQAYHISDQQNSVNLVQEINTDLSHAFYGYLFTD
jgi:hypothetical protein